MKKEFIFLDKGFNRLLPPEKEMMIKFEQEAEQLTGITEPMGVREISLERSKRIGVEQGIERGTLLERAKALEEKKQIARNFKNKDIAFYIIAEATGLSIKEIETL
ncbi:hypothetical protein [Pedobacter foliorum]|uniref:hypothetical protein n=1 Tax=Pedobacter foliorum TaxID=2739058 RepID=UPI0015643C89|nr:hypothetical protein [Pedobacter foliorum]NRF37949.1 hypothetical protein [Pedobacter foliorum]